MSTRFVLIITAIVAVLLSACGGAPAATAPGASKVQASPVQYIGVVESIDGSQWVVNGQTISVDPSVIRGGPFQAGDTVKVELAVNSDGSVSVSRVEAPSAADLAGLPRFGDDNSNDANANDDNSNDANVNDDNSNDANSNEAGASGDEIFGTVEAVSDTSITIGGLTYDFQPGAEIKSDILVGAFVKVHLVQNADGTVSVREIELSDPSEAENANDNGNGNANDDNSNGDNTNTGDDHGGNGGGGGGNGSDDHGGGGGGGGGGGNNNDDHGGNSNDD